MKFNILISSLLLLLVTNTFAAYDLEKVCELDRKKKTDFYTSTKKMIQVQLGKMKDKSPEWKEFEETQQYDWIRFTVPKSLPAFAAPHDRDVCATMYEAFVNEKRPIAATEKLTSWKNCLVSQYRETIPEMAQKLVDCHSGGSTKLDPQPTTSEDPDQTADATKSETE